MIEWYWLFIGLTADMFAGIITRVTHVQVHVLDLKAYMHKFHFTPTKKGALET